jgi:hypothetical protein
MFKFFVILDVMFNLAMLHTPGPGNAYLSKKKCFDGLITNRELQIISTLYYYYYYYYYYYLLVFSTDYQLEEPC